MPRYSVFLSILPMPWLKLGHRPRLWRGRWRGLRLMLRLTARCRADTRSAKDRGTAQLSPLVSNLSRPPPPSFSHSHSFSRYVVGI